jgi:hypothetical protein
MLLPLAQRSSPQDAHAWRLLLPPVAASPAAAAHQAAAAWSVVQTTYSGEHPLQQLDVHHHHHHHPHHPHRGSVSHGGQVGHGRVDASWRSAVHRACAAVLRRARAVFLPHGYPHSVPAGGAYRRFAAWQAVKYAAGTASSIVATQALLRAIGVGAAAAVPLSASVQWVLKDGLGQLGGVLYAMAVGSRFDADPKRQHMRATAALQAATLLETLTPALPSLFLPIAAAANMAKNMAWIAVSATRAQMNRSFAVRENLGDITGKATSQTIAASLVGTALGVSLSAAVAAVAATDSALASVATTLAVLPLSALALIADWFACRAVTLRTLNEQRAERIWSAVCSSPAWPALVGAVARRGADAAEVDRCAALVVAAVPSPTAVSHMETFIRRFSADSPSTGTVLGEPSVFAEGTARALRAGHGVAAAGVSPQVAWVLAAVSCRVHEQQLLQPSGAACQYVVVAGQRDAVSNGSGVASSAVAWWTVRRSAEASGHTGRAAVRASFHARVLAGALAASDASEAVADVERSAAAIVAAIWPRLEASLLVRKAGRV